MSGDDVDDDDDDGMTGGERNKRNIAQILRELDSASPAITYWQPCNRRIWKRKQIIIIVMCVL